MNPIPTPLVQLSRGSEASSMDLTLRPPRPPPPDYPLPRTPDDESSTYESPSIYARDDDDGWGSDEFPDDQDEYGFIGDAQLDANYAPNSTIEELDEDYEEPYDLAGTDLSYLKASRVEGISTSSQPAPQPLMNPTGMFVAVTANDKNLKETTTLKPPSPSSASANPAINLRVKALASQISSSLIFPSQSGHKPADTVDKFDPYSRQDKRHSRNCDNDEILLSGTEEDEHRAIEEKSPTEKSNSKYPSPTSSAPPINSRVKALASQISSSLVFPSQSGNELEETDNCDPYSRRDRRHSRFTDNDDVGLNPTDEDEYQAIEKKQVTGVMGDEYQALSLNGDENAMLFHSDDTIQTMPGNVVDRNKMIAEAETMLNELNHQVDLEVDLNKKRRLRSQKQKVIDRITKFKETATSAVDLDGSHLPRAVSSNEDAKKSRDLLSKQPDRLDQLHESRLSIEEDRDPTSTPADAISDFSPSPPRRPSRPRPPLKPKPPSLRAQAPWNDRPKNTNQPSPDNPIRPPPVGLETRTSSASSSQPNHEEPFDEYADVPILVTTNLSEDLRERVESKRGFAKKKYRNEDGTPVTAPPLSIPRTSLGDDSRGSRTENCDTTGLPPPLFANQMYPSLFSIEGTPSSSCDRFSVFLNSHFQDQPPRASQPFASSSSDQPPPPYQEAVGEAMSPDKWSCEACTFLNTLDSEKCDICETQRPAKSSASVAVTEGMNRLEKLRNSSSYREMLEAEGRGLLPKKYLIAKKKMEACWSFSDQFSLGTASSNVNLVMKWIADNWDSTVKEVISLATWRYAGFNPPFTLVEEAFLVNDGDVEDTLKHIAPESGTNVTLKDPMSSSVDALIDVSAIQTDTQTDPLTSIDPNGLTQSQAKLFTGLKRFEGEFTTEEILDAARSCNSLYNAYEYLHQECMVCFMKVSAPKIVGLPTCECKLCGDCFGTYFKSQIREKSVLNFGCPTCNKPEININIDEAHIYFQILDPMLRQRSDFDEEDMNLFHQKLRDWQLSGDPNFRWCAHCETGFLWQNSSLKMQCFQCNQHTCFHCKNRWLKEHDNMSCDDFKAWKSKKESEEQQSIYSVLDTIGLVCPKCRAKFVLSKGGCLHFNCSQCRHQFCQGCMEQFHTLDDPCLTCPNRKGLHCHHPRNCIFYLRDFSVRQLQDVLVLAAVPFTRDSPLPSVQTPKGMDKLVPKWLRRKEKPTEMSCQIVEAKEVGNSLVDEPCGRPIEVRSAHLCELHYKEYLVQVINTHHLDPIDSLSLRDVIVIAQREAQFKGITLPSRLEEEAENDYKTKLIGILKENSPLRRS